MSEAGRCPRCGGPISKVGAIGGRCPRCMFEKGLETASETGNDILNAGKQREGAAPPASIGRYRILRVIGEGGMGVVYEAEQDQPHRTVALKVIKPGMANPELLRRFEQEAQALGRLQHPGIAQIYEAGTVDTGFGPQPYFAMEHIRGISPRDYAESQHLNTSRRLEIMVKICDAVHHAHQRGLIHRDLKPGNILVDETGQPKILDFGVARVTDSDTRSTIQTDMGQLIGTLAYMSPEQALADPLDIDTRSDVYALGVIMYELLAGRLPYAVSRKIHETIKAIREEEPTRLGAVNRTYRGDIETIVGKALEKDRTRRYASAAGMAADLRRFLQDEPIAARPPSTSYQLRKFIHRHRVLVAAGAAVFVVLVAGVAASTWWATQATHERDTANERRDERDRAVTEAKAATQIANAATKRADAAALLAREQLAIAVAQTGRADTETAKKKVLLDFIGIDLLGKAEPFAQSAPGRTNKTQTSPNPGITLKEALDLAVKQIPARFDRQPLQEAEIREFVADIYVGMGRYDEGRDQLKLTVDLRRREQGEIDPETLRATEKLADVYADLNLYPEAEDLAKRVIVGAQRSPGNVDPYVRAAVVTLAWIYGGTLRNPDPSRGFPQMDRFLKDEVIDYQRRKYGEGSSTAQFAANQLLSIYTDFKPPKYSEAQAFLLRIANDRRRALGEGSPVALDAEKQLIGYYLIPQPQPKYADAEAYLKPLFETQRRTLGDDNPATQATMNYLVSVYLDQKPSRFADAEVLLKRVQDDARRKFGIDSRAARNASIGLANLYFAQARYPEAASLLLPFASSASIAEATSHPLTLAIEPAIRNELDLSSQIYGKRGNAAPNESMAHLTQIEHPTIVDALDRLSRTYGREGNSVQDHATTGKLKTMMETAINFVRKTGRGEENLAPLLKSMGAIAIRHIERNDFGEAELMLSTIVDGYRDLTMNNADARINTTKTISTGITITNPGNDSQRDGYQSAEGRNARSIATLLTSAAITYTANGDKGRAEALLKTVLDINHSAMGDSSWDTQLSLWRLGAWYMDQGRYEDAHTTFDDLNKIQTVFYGATHTITRTTLVDMTLIYSGRVTVELSEGRRARALSLVETRLNLNSRLLDLYRGEPGGVNSSNTRVEMFDLAVGLAILGRYADAEKVFTQLSEIQRTAEGVPQEESMGTLAHLGWAQFHQQKYAESEASLRAALHGLESIQSDTWTRHNTESMLGAALVAEKKYVEAEAHLQNSYTKILQRKPVLYASGFAAESEFGERILTLYQEWGKPEEVAKLRLKLQANKSAAAAASPISR